ILNATGLPLQDLMLGASVYFPPFFKAFALGFVIWLFIHRLLRDRIYLGMTQHFRSAPQQEKLLRNLSAHCFVRFA
ncbi:hypothetical protein F434_20476, partial [Salmonella enterica subsp. enterica serovar Agona str. SH11G1113]